MGLTNKLLVVMLAGLGTWGCQTLIEESPTQPEPVALPSVTPPPVTAPAQAPSPAPVPTPAPTPSATPDPGPIYDIRVAFFGIKCTNGKPEPNNGWRELPVGCRGYVTATPKKKDGTDVPANQHGPDIDWYLFYGDEFVRVDPPTFPSDFNKDLVGLKVGTFGLCAVVRGVTGCLAGRVTP